MTMAIAEQDIWGKLVTASSRGFLRWRPDIDRLSGGDPRSYPERYMAMCGNLHTLDEHGPVLGASDLVEKEAGVYEAPDGEITGVNGLLRVVDKFPITILPPDNILLVGAISPNSLMSTIVWCQENGWNESQLTLVDKSPIPIETIRLMKDGGYFDWSGGIELAQEDVVDYVPAQKPDVIVADILNMWMVDKYYYPHLDKKSPYSVFERLLEWASDSLDDNGWFFSRCMISPESNGGNDPNLRFKELARKRTERILGQLGSVANDVNRGAVEDTVEELFERAYPTTFCGLEKVSKTYQSAGAVSGKQAEKVFRRFYKRGFEITHEVDVLDTKSGFKFLNFACQS